MRNTEKKCTKCGITKPIDEFYKSKSKSHQFNRLSWCKECMKANRKRVNEETAYFDKWRTEMADEIANRTDRGLAFLRQRMWHSAKARAITYTLDFSITKEDIHIPTHCPVLGIELQATKGALSDNSPTLDRIDSMKGYVVGNVQVISNKANRIKTNATSEDVEKVLTWMRQQS